MCKLCNTDRPSVKIPSSTIIQITVHDYLDEYCCNYCYCSLKKSTQQNAKDLDRAILLKLYYSYRGYTGRELGKDKEKLIPPNRYKGSLFGIIQLNNSYSARIGNKTIGVYHTLIDALEAKLNYCIKNNYPKIITQIQNKLKELQCQK